MARENAHRLFARLARDLDSVCGDYPGKMACPLCLTLFTEDAVDMAEPLLTEEHIIPGELGGRLTTLTCKGCNNRHGAELDSQLIQRLRVHDALDGEHEWPLKGRIEVAGMTVPADIDWRAHRHDTTQFQLRRFDPAVHAAIKQSFRDGNVDNINVHFSFGYIPYRTDIAILRIAYLASFRNWGYRFILTPAIQLMRNLINDFETVNDRVPEIVGEIRDISPIPPEPIQFLRFEEAIMAVITLRAVTERYYATLLPFPGAPPEDVLNILVRGAHNIRARRGTVQPTRQ
ncbi:MAG: HNH endonuclease [Bryobacteraceae bacterium]